MPKRPLGIILLIVACAASYIEAATGPETGSSLVQDLQRLGYENIAFRQIDDTTVTIWCENRRIRYPVVWMIEALALTAEYVSPQTKVRLIAQSVGRPIVALTSRAIDVRRWIEGQIGTEAFQRTLSVEYAAQESAPERLNSSLRRFDLILGPGRMLSQFGLPGSYARLQVDASAELTTALWAGTIAYGRVLIPVHNHGGPIGGDSRYGEIRPGSILVSHFRPLGSTAFTSIAAGHFELGNRKYDSYGIMVDLRHYTPDGRWSFGWYVGCIGYAAYVIDNDRIGRHRIWELSWPPENWPYQAEVQYRVTGFDLTLTGRWGRFLGGDHGWRIDVARKFGELGMTIFGIKSDGAFDGTDRVNRKDVRLLGGIRLEMPIYPRTRGIPDRFRVTSIHAFAWAYQYRTGDVGVDVRTQHRVEDLIAQYNPVTIRNNLERARTFVNGTSFERERVRRGVTTSLKQAGP